MVKPIENEKNYKYTNRKMKKGKFNAKRKKNKLDFFSHYIFVLQDVYTISPQHRERYVHAVTERLLCAKKERLKLYCLLLISF